MTTSTQPTAPYPHPTPSPAAKPIRRSSDGALGGVATGIARYFDIDVKWVRIAFLVSLIPGGFGFNAYLAAWLAIPTEADPRTDRVIFSQNVVRLIAAGVFALFAVGALSGAATLSAGLLVPAALVGGGVYLLMQDDEATSKSAGLSQPGPSPAGPGPVPGNVAGGQYPKAERPVGPDAQGAVPPPPGSVGPMGEPAEPADERDPLLVEAERLMTGEAYTLTRADEPAHWALTHAEADVLQKPRRRRPPIATAAMGVALLVSILSLATNSSIGVIGYAAIFAIMAITGFILSLFWRRPAWALIPVGLIAMILTVGSAAVGPVVDQGFGEVTVDLGAVEADSAGGSNYEFGVGRVAVVAENIVLSEDQNVSFDLGIGEIALDLPDEYRVELYLERGAFLQLSDGDPIRLSDGTVAVFNSEVEDGPVLKINASIGAGVVTVDRQNSETVFE